MAGDTRKLLGLIGAVLAPATLLTALAYYFGWRRERAFAGYFGIDPSVLGFSTSDYVLRSVDALVVPVSAVLLVVFAVFCLHALLADRLEPLNTAPILAALGLGAIGIGIALAAGHPITTSYGYLQALGPGVGALLLVYALLRWRSATGTPVTGLTYLAAAGALVSLFWATAEYADSRGRSQAEQLARNLAVNPTATIFSKEDLNIDPLGPGSGAAGECQSLVVTKTRGGAYPYRYAGFSLLIRSGGKYFLTPGTDAWRPDHAIFILADDAKIRVELMRGNAYPVNVTESTFSPQQLPFTC